MELSMLALHLLQICLVLVNTLVIQQVLAERSGAKRLTKEYLRELTPLIYAHVNPYGILLLDIRVRFPIESIYKTAAQVVTLRLVVEMLGLPRLAARRNSGLIRGGYAETQVGAHT
jgi:hypothetical protein